MKYFGFLLLFLCFFSCSYFDNKKVKAEDLLKEELQTFNWNQVDEYPSFESCNSAENKPDRKQCFETTLATFVSTGLSTYPFVVTESISDTVLIEFHISEIGELSIQAIKSDSLTRAKIPELDSILEHSIDGLPKILPAIKRGQRVKTTFQLPVIINTN